MAVILRGDTGVVGGVAPGKGKIITLAEWAAQRGMTEVEARRLAEDQLLPGAYLSLKVWLLKDTTVPLPRFKKTVLLSTLVEKLQNPREGDAFINALSAEIRKGTFGSRPVKAKFNSPTIHTSAGGLGQVYQRSFSDRAIEDSPALHAWLDKRDKISKEIAAGTRTIRGRPKVASKTAPKTTPMTGNETLAAIKEGSMDFDVAAEQTMNAYQKQQTKANVAAAKAKAQEKAAQAEESREEPREETPPARRKRQRRGRRVYKRLQQKAGGADTDASPAAPVLPAPAAEPVKPLEAALAPRTITPYPKEVQTKRSAGKAGAATPQKSATVAGRSKPAGRSRSGKSK